MAVARHLGPVMLRLTVHVCRSAFAAKGAALAGDLHEGVTDRDLLLSRLLTAARLTPLDEPDECSPLALAPATADDATEVGVATATQPAAEVSAQASSPPLGSLPHTLDSSPAAAVAEKTTCTMDVDVELVAEEVQHVASAGPTHDPLAKSPGATPVPSISACGALDVYRADDDAPSAAPPCQLLRPRRRRRLPPH